MWQIREQNGPFCWRISPAWAVTSNTGVDLIALPSAFTDATGRARWESPLRAGAIENQCCVIAAAQPGEHPDPRRTWGHSIVIDDWGRILTNLGTSVGAACVSIDISVTTKIRQDFPALDHRRFDIFGA